MKGYDSSALALEMQQLQEIDSGKTIQIIVSGEPNGSSATQSVVENLRCLA